MSMSPEQHNVFRNRSKPKKYDLVAIVNIISTDRTGPLGARASAGTVIIGSYVCIGLAREILDLNLLRNHLPGHVTPHIKFIPNKRSNLFVDFLHGEFARIYGNKS